MPDLEPAQFQVYGLPVADSFVTSLQMRQQLEALARNFYSTSSANPQENRSGQIRVLADDPTNVKIQVYLNGVYRTFAQSVQDGVAAPIKQIVQVPVGTPLAQWTINHNLGTQPVVLVFDTGFTQLQVFPATGGVERVYLGSIPSSVLSALPGGLTTLRTALPVEFNGILESAFAVAAEAVTGVPDGTLEFEIAGQGAMTGGDITLAATALGVTIAGAAATATNILTAGGTLDVRANITTAPTAGSLDLFAVVRRTPNLGQYTLANPTINQVLITHPAAISGFAVLIG